MLERQTVIDQRMVTENGTLLVRRATYIVDTDTGERVAGPVFHRTSYEPGADVSAEDAAVKRVSVAEWTDAVVRAYRKKQSRTKQGGMDRRLTKVR